VVFGGEEREAHVFRSFAAVVAAAILTADRLVATFAADLTVAEAFIMVAAAAVLLTDIVGTEVGTGGGMGRTETEGVSGAADGMKEAGAVSRDDGRLADFGRRRDSVEMRIAADFPTFDDPDRAGRLAHSSCIQWKKP
jgi:hypothetical protein